MSKNAYLILENGTVFKGKSFGAEGEVIGEVVFTTSMTGYIETLTDPSYYGQLVVQTFPLIGNYGIIPSDFEGKKPQLKAYIVKEWCQVPSNFRSEGNLDTFLKDNGIIGLYDIDTRKLTKIVREYGVMNGKIVVGDLPENFEENIKQFKAKGAVSQVSCTSPQYFEAENAKYNVVIMDFGAKYSIRHELVKRGCNVTVVPYNTTVEQIMKMNPDGIMMSNGPGDPAENVEVINEVRKILDLKIPTFGICLGHQLMALSQGAKSIKLKYGHRGANQPAIHVATGRVYITSQNHGYTILSSTLPVTAKASYLNANDDTCEGVEYSNMPAFSVQFHPEAAAGPLDTSFIFDDFIKLIEEEKVNAVK